MKRIKALLSKVKFTLGYNPIIVRRKDWSDYIPEQYKSIIIISADFELAWASRYTKNSSKPLEHAIKHAKQARENIPIILQICDKYNIPITWATVGHLFLEGCKKKNGKAHPNIKRLPYFENKYWKYDSGDWFDCDPCSNWKESPGWYAPDLIQEILNKKVKHEIGCHTFSHIDCRDEVCSPEVFESEIVECQKLAKKYGIELVSFVHPGHTIGNLDSLAKLGFTSYRTDYRNTLCYPIKHKNGLWEFKQTMEFVYRPAWSIKYHIYRYKKIIDRAIKSNTVCYFWFHPSMDEIFTNRILPVIFSYIIERKDEIWTGTSQAYTQFLNQRI